MSTSRKILLLTATFPPRGGSGVQRVGKFLKYMGLGNLKGVVVTSLEENLCYRDDSLLKDIPADVEVLRTRKVPFGKHKSTEKIICAPSPKYQRRYGFAWLLKRLLYPDEYMLWGLGAIKVIREVLNRKECTLILSSLGSPTTLLLGYFAKRYSGLPWVIDVRYFWSLNQMKFGHTSRGFPLSTIDRVLDRFLFRRADHVCVVSDAY